jgi:hypothetical protein
MSCCVSIILDLPTWTTDCASSISTVFVAGVANTKLGFALLHIILLGDFYYTPYSELMILFQKYFYYAQGLMMTPSIRNTVFIAFKAWGLGLLLLCMSAIFYTLYSYFTDSLTTPLGKNLASVSMFFVLGGFVTMFFFVFCLVSMLFLRRYAARQFYLVVPLCMLGSFLNFTYFPYGKIAILEVSMPLAFISGLYAFLAFQRLTNKLSRPVET